MKCLVVVAHPVDEILGAGATIHKLTSQKIQVDICILCSQAQARFDRPDDDTLRKNLMMANLAVGSTHVYMGDYADSHLSTAPHLEVVQYIEKVICSSQATHIITHHPGDLNSDHKVTSMCCQEASRISLRKSRKDAPQVKCIAYMEVPSSTDWGLDTSTHTFRPNTFVNVGLDGVQAKIMALRQYKGVMRPFPHPRCKEVIQGLAAVRGGQSGCEYAEAFETAWRVVE